MNNIVKNSKTSPKKSVTAKQLAKSNLTKRKNPDWDNLDKGYRYLTLDMKLPHDLAVAVMGNVVEESRGDYKAVLKNGGRRGLIQWDGKNVPSGRYGLWGSIWASVAKPANVYDSTTDTVKNYWAPWGGLKGDKVRLRFIKAPIKEKARIYAESYIRSGKNSRIADRQLSAMQLDSIYNPRIKDIIVLKNGGQIRKMLTAAGGPLNLSPEDIKRGANLVGEWFLKGLGAFGKIATAPFRSQGPTSATIYKSKELLAKERTIENKSEELLGKAMTWVSPLNYGAALATGNGLNARKGEEEVASWSPAWQALGRAAELYVGPKAVKGVKATPRVVVNTAAKVGVKPAKAAVIARKMNKAIKEIPNSDIVDNIGKKWFTDEVTFKSPFRVKEHIGQTVGDVIDFNLGLYGGSKATLASLTPNQRYSLAKLLWLTDERPVMSKLIHMEDSGTLPISRTGFVPKDASNSNSVWNSSLGSNAPEIWYLEGTPYYSAYGYPNISNIPRTIITDRQSLNNIGINLKGNKVIRHEGEIPFNLIELGIQYNPITGFFDKIKFDSGTKSSKTSSTIQISPEELYKVLKDQELNGYYFMGHGTGRTRVNPQTIFDNGLRIKGGDISNTTMPISESNLTSWPHMNSEEIIIMPGKATMTKYDSAHGHIPSDWYSSDVFHWTDNPKKVGSGPFAAFEPNASFTEQTIGGVPGVYTKPEAVLGSYNTRTHTLKLNPRSLYEFLFNVPKLTEPLTSLKFFERKPSKSVTREYVQSPKDITSDVGDLIAEGSERSVYASKSNPNIVYKIEDGNAPLEDINNIKIRTELTDDIIAPETTIGYFKHKNGKYYRVTQLDKYKSFNPDNYDADLSPELNLEIINTLEKAGWKVNIKNGLAATASKNGVTIGNLEHFNWGRDSKGNLKLIDLYVAERNPSKNNIVGASLDYSMKDSKGMDFIKQFFALLKINGKEYTLEGLKDAKNVQQGLPEYIQSYLNLNTVERAVRAMRKNGYSEREILLYVDKVNEEMNKVKVGMYSDLEYNAAGALDFGGFYNSDTNFISINKDAWLTKPAFTPNYIMKHEGRHLIDYNTSMTDDVINILEKAYDKDFLEIPKHEDAGSLKDYLHMDRERVTTNRDAREVLLSNLEKHPGEFLNLTKFVQTSSGKYKDMVDFLNELILYAEPEDIINAVENSNGYGKRYINYLKKNNKLTSTKIEQLRLAMIHVPSYLLPVAGGYTLYNIFNQPQQQLQYLKQGGKMNVLEFLKNGSGIHIKKKNRGKFTAYCGGNVTSACIAKAKASGNPTLVKRATFVANARKWKHQNGGTLLKYLIGGYVQPSNVLEAINNGSAAGGLLTGFGKVMNKILPTWFLKAGTYLSPLNYAAALSKGSINPKVGEKVVSTWHPNLLLAARMGEAIFGGKAIKNTPKAVVNTAAKAGVKSAKKVVVARKINKVVNGTKDLSKLLAFNLFQELTSAPTSKITRLRPEFSLAMQDKNYMFGKLLWSTNLTKDRYATSLTKHIKVMDTKQADPQIYVTQALYPLAIENRGLRATHGGLTRPIWLNSNKPYFGTPTGVSNSTNYTYVIDANKFTPKLNLLRNIGETHYEYPGTVQLPIEGTKRILWDPVLLLYTSTIFTEAPKLTEPSTSLKFFERRPAKISEAERAGVPKGERFKNKKHYTGIGRNYRGTLFGEENIPKDIEYVEPITSGKKFGESDYSFDNRKYATKQYLKELNNRDSGIFSDKGVESIKEYISLLSDDINPNFINTNGLLSFYIRDFRLYLNDLGYKAGDLTDTEIAKLLTNLYDILSKNLSGKLKGKVVFHSGPNFFDLFDFTHTGETMGNMGYLGPGNYFSTKPSIYGGKGNYTTQDLIGQYRYPRRLPYLINNIKSTPVSGELKRAKIIPEYTSPPRETYGDALAKNNYILLVILPLVKSTKVRDMAVLDDISVSPHSLYTSGVQTEFMVPRNTGIKSLYPHPSLFIKDANGKVTLNRNWDDIRVNYKQGGKMNLIDFLKNGGQVRKMQTAAGGPIYEKDWSDKVEPYAAGIGLAGDAIGLGAATTGIGVPVGVAIAGFANTPNLIIDGYLTARDTWRSFKDNGNSLGSAVWNGGEFLLDALGLKALQYINKAAKAGVASTRVLNGSEKAATSSYRRVGTGAGRMMAKRSAEAKRVYNAARNKALKESNAELAKKGVRAIQGAYYEKKLAEAMAKRGYGVAANDAIKSANRTVRLNLGIISGVSGGTNIYHIFKKDNGGILELLKKGSKIHIKEKNKGKFTSYCGGKVTNECILKGKNSSNPAIRKRATFAANARKWKHEDGGELIKKHEEGAKLTFGLKLGNFANSDLGKSVISNGLSFLSDKLFNKSASSNLEIALAAQEKELPTIDPMQVAQMIEIARDQYADSDNPNANGGDIFNSYIKNQITTPILARQLEEHKKRLAAIDLQKNQAKSSAVGTFFNTLAQGGIEYLLNKYGKTEKADS